jgi:hypothetical protein
MYPLYRVPFKNALESRYLTLRTNWSQPQICVQITLFQDMLNALEKLRASIPPFTSWQTDALEQAFAQYSRILNELTRNERLAFRYRDLVENSALIAWLIADAKSSGSAVSYDRGAMELSWDIDSLIQLLSI